MDVKNEKVVLQLNIDELDIAGIRLNLRSRSQVAEAIGVSTSQLWRASRPPEDPNHNAPGPTLIAGVLKVFGEPFERFFFLK